MTSPRVSVLVPSYNHARYLRERILSIVNQTYQNFELIVIDDCSDDESDSVILDLQGLHGFDYRKNSRNSGTPFSAWEKIKEMAKGDYIWVCESDDVAEPTFLERAISDFEANPSAALFYCSSNVIDEDGLIIGHTDNFFHEIWKEHRWDQSFTASGLEELIQFQLRGQTVPNMSSALIKVDAFKRAFEPFLLRFRLTGDWLFIGNVMKQGNIIFCRDALSNFRKHAITSRERVKSARSQAEFILTKYRLFRGSSQPASDFASVMSSDVIRFLYEPASAWEVARALTQVSIRDSVGCLGLLVFSVLFSPELVMKFGARYRHAKEIRNS